MKRLLLALLLLAPAWAEPADEVLARVAGIHGNAGVFATAGYRMGQRALQELGLARGDFQLQVVHRTPFQVQYSCVADGWQAATGVSAGKLNLRLEECPADQMQTTVRDARSGKALVFRLRPEFLQQYLNTPYDRQSQAAREVLTLPDSRIFDVQTAP